MLVEIGGDEIAATAKAPDALLAAKRQELREKLGLKSPDELPDWFSMLLFALPGGGKTHLIGTASNYEELCPILLVDVDGGWETVQKLPHRDRIDIREIRSYDQARKLWLELFEAVENQRLPWKTGCIDSLSELYKIDLADINAEMAKNNPKIDPDHPDQSSYYKVQTRISRLMRNYRDLPWNMIYTAHEREKENEFKQIQRRPLFAGQMEIAAPGFVSIVGHLRTEVKANGEATRYLQTQQTPTLTVKDRYGFLDPIERDPDMGMIWSKFQDYKLRMKGDK